MLTFLSLVFNLSALHCSRMTLQANLACRLPCTRLTTVTLPFNTPFRRLRRFYEQTEAAMGSAVKPRSTDQGLMRLPHLMTCDRQLTVLVDRTGTLPVYRVVNHTVPVLNICFLTSGQQFTNVFQLNDSRTPPANSPRISPARRSLLSS